MSSKEPTLAYTVHHKGRKYSAGQTASDVGDVAGEFGEHVWVDGNAPAKSSGEKSSGTDGGSQLGSPPVPPPSALPTPTVTTDSGGGDGDGGSQARRTTITGGSSRRGNGSSS